MNAGSCEVVVERLARWAIAIRTNPRQMRRAAICAACALLLIGGCSRSHYRQAADQQSYGILQEKNQSTPWQPPLEFRTDADPRSRLFQDDTVDCPTLPDPRPKLYSYSLTNPIGVSEQSDQSVAGEPRDMNAQEHASVAVLVVADGNRVAGELVPASYQEKQPKPGSSGANPAATNDAPEESGAGRRLPPVPDSAWNAMPATCLARMFEFQSVRDEYKRTFSADPASELRDHAPKVTLEQILELALLNSREYQTQKEALYRAALALTLERFDYELKFTPTGNGTNVNYDHARRGGITTDSLGIPSRVQTNKMLTTGGDLLARFANDVVLTFNGPDGFAADVSSQLFFNFSQALLQRDVRFEPLIQAERDVIYAARSFARFRKQFFFQRASEYYSLILNYRQIEIDAQNYFSLVRELVQAEEEERTGIQRAPSRVQVEQIEQSMLSGRSRVITTCNSLENAQDRLKLSLGLPTETPINIDLTELNQLTQLDEGEVARERAMRALRRVRTVREQGAPKELASKDPKVRTEAAVAFQSANLTAALVLIERTLSWAELVAGVQDQPIDLTRIRELERVFQVGEARIDANLLRQDLTDATKQVPPPPALLLFQRTLDLVEGLQKLADRQLAMAAIDPENAQTATFLRQRLTTEIARAKEQRNRLATTLDEGELARLPELLSQAEALLADAEATVQLADKAARAPAQQLAPDEELTQTLDRIDSLLSQAESILTDADSGLVRVAIDADDAMMTALVSRFDLMNSRGFVADDWRAIKYAADDLRSVMNLNVAQTIGTRGNRPFDFTFDESRTTAGVTFDLPLNRRSQRNNYRRSLINYQVALRNLMQLEDNIKFDVRNGLRNLDLRRVQYQISVASAALAYERVTSTRLELNLGLGNVAARDFLEAQDAFRSAVSSVAQNHINYTVDRTRFFFDLELLDLDESGFWPEIYDQSFQPVPRKDFLPDTGRPYGDLPDYLKVSRELKRMQQ